MPEESPMLIDSRAFLHRPVNLLAGMAMFVLVWGIGISLSPSEFMTFLDYPSLVITAGNMAIFLMIAHGIVPSLQGLAIAATGRVRNANDVRLAVAICDSGLQGCVLSGTLGTLTGLTFVLSNLRVPDQLGPGMVISLFTLLYSVVLASFFVAGRYQLANLGCTLFPNESPSSAEFVPPLSASPAVFLALLLGLDLFAFLMLWCSVVFLKK